MRRRQFNQGALGAAVAGMVGLAGCGGGGGGGGTPGGSGAGPASAGGDPSPVPEDQPAAALSMLLGTNLSGMEWATSVRVSGATVPNVDFTVPRAAEIRWLAANGFGRNRLPVMWELLQPMLATTAANAQAQALIGPPGAFHEPYARFIDGVLDAHAAVGARCILDCHNYCRYTDFRFQPDGSVIGLAAPADPGARAFTTDPAQVLVRIFATAPGATLVPAAFADFWQRAARRWGRHPGFGGYGLMNEPHDMPRPGQVVESRDGGEDLSIWPVFARAAIDAIRAVDPSGPIYLAGNNWGGAMNIGPEFNPAWPLADANLLYEVHSYLDAWNNGAGFDWDLELAKDFVAGFGPGRMTLDTGRARMQIATDWARAHGTRVALTETGMPVDDPRWHDAFRRLMDHSWANRCEVQSWMGGSHWLARNHAITHAPGWHQGRTQEPLVAGVMKATAGIDRAVLFDDGPGDAAGGAAVTITVSARGALAAPVQLQVSSDNGGVLSKTTLVIPAGANGQDSYSFTPLPERITTLRYTALTPLGRQVPPPRSVYSLADPVAFAATQPAAGARALLARHAASRWDLADGFSDYVLGRPAQEGERVRAVADSGFGSGPGNAMEMLNWVNQDGPGMGPLQPPLMRRAGRPHADLSAPGSLGFWCRKLIPGGTFPNARNRCPYGIADPHFVIAAIALPAAGAGGTVFQAAVATQDPHAELAVDAGQPVARWLDAGGRTQVLTGPPLAVGPVAVLTLTSAPGRQQLRVNSALVASGSASFAPSPFSDLLIGWGHPPRGVATAFRGAIYALVTGRGDLSPAELAVLERDLAG